MSTVNMPGFSAEGSVYASTTRYRSIAAGVQGNGANVNPAQFGCLPYAKCSACIPKGPAAFGPGRQFCQWYSCRMSGFGGCRCTVVHKGFQDCYVPAPDEVKDF